ncbi:hypothetical protein J2S74_003833 [Evansella vedderi]|uniref:Uncharacterized protein n=1 Tax=Evansella vedderi TaxID=38282 RepID=A0ABT9ZYU5_9BACI|nr:hypothetical protein [Evansella vedderi]MDQ0256413.1 hypothetical protein [Evansella vedderi]
MKNVRLLVSTIFIIIFFLFFLSFYFFAQNLNNPVSESTAIPFETFYIYNLETNGEVGINILNLLIVSFVLSIPLFFILKFFSSFISNKLAKKGRI